MSPSHCSNFVSEVLNTADEQFACECKLGENENVVHMHVSYCASENPNLTSRCFFSAGFFCAMQDTNKRQPKTTKRQPRDNFIGHENSEAEFFKGQKIQRGKKKRPTKTKVAVMSRNKLETNSL